MDKIGVVPKEGQMLKRLIVAVTTCSIVLSVGLLALACHKEVGNPVGGWYSAEVGIPGDINLDGQVDLTDLAMLGRAWQTSSGDPAFNQCADFNRDGTVNLVDQAILGQHWQEKGFQTNHHPNAQLPGHRAWLSGLWFADPSSEKVTLDFEKIRFEGGSTLSPNSGRLRLLSPGDTILACHKYASDGYPSIEFQQTATTAVWWYNRYFNKQESWMVVVQDNGDRHVTAELWSCIGAVIGSESEPGYWAVAVQVIEIGW